MTSIATPTSLPTSWPAQLGPAVAPMRHVEWCMGTMFSFHIAAPGIARADLFPVLAWLHDMDALFSTYRRDSQISAINVGRLRPDDADDEVREVLAACEVYRQRTSGYFDARADGRRLDPSGYVKGWAVQSASDLLVAAGAANHYVNGGGDVVCVGQRAPGQPWRVGVVDPHHSDRIVRTVSAPGPVAVATSGLAERGAHILDPHTGLAATELASVTVVARDLVTADVYATAAAAMGLTRAVEWLSAQDDIHATLITAGREITEI
jgi:FAD:protein FMN transferase